MFFNKRDKSWPPVHEAEVIPRKNINTSTDQGVVDFPMTKNDDKLPNVFTMVENEERLMIGRKSLYDPKVQELIEDLINWVNDELADQRIIIKSLKEDLYDGLVLQKLYEKLTRKKLDVPELTQSEEGQRQKLGVVLASVNKVLGLGSGTNKWSVESVHSKSLVSILYLLVSLVFHFRPLIRLPENVNISMVIVQKKDGSLIYSNVVDDVTGSYDEPDMSCERDDFDTQFDQAPDKLKKSLLRFVNKHLNKINLKVTDLETQFHDGVYLTLLMGLLEGFYVPHYFFFLAPKTFEDKVHNVSFAFQLIEFVGLPRPSVRPQDIVNLDLKSTLRVVYNLFVKYKSMS